MSPRNKNSVSNDDLAKILSKLLDGIIIVGKNGVIKYANIAAATLFNKKIEKLVGEEFGYLIIPQKVQDIQIIQDKRILFVQMLCSTIEWEGEDGCLISLRDVTELKKKELDLNVERQKLEQSNQELSQYASMASHDLKEPLRKIMTYSRMLKDRYSGVIGEQPFRLIDKIHRSAVRLGSVIDGVSKFSNIRTKDLQMSPVDLNQVISQVIEDIDILIIEKKVIVNMSNLPMVNGDSSLLYQLFLNLITNSIKYSKNMKTPLINISGRLEDGIVIVTVEDNGVGFDNKFAKRIFEPFQRLLTDGYDGSGIGLAICKKIVDTHKGEIIADSSVNVGTRITIRLPQVLPVP